MGKAGACDMGGRKFTRRVLVPAQVVSTGVLTDNLRSRLPSATHSGPREAGSNPPSHCFPLDGEKRNSLPQIPTL